MPRVHAKIQSAPLRGVVVAGDLAAIPVNNAVFSPGQEKTLVSRWLAAAAGKIKAPMRCTTSPAVGGATACGPVVRLTVALPGGCGVVDLHGVVAVLPPGVPLIAGDDVGKQLGLEIDVNADPPVARCRRRRGSDAGGTR